MLELLHDRCVVRASSTSVVPSEGLPALESLVYQNSETEGACTATTRFNSYYDSYETIRKKNKLGCCRFVFSAFL